MIDIITIRGGFIMTKRLITLITMLAVLVSVVSFVPMAAANTGFPYELTGPFNNEEWTRWENVPANIRAAADMVVVEYDGELTSGFAFAYWSSTWIEYGASAPQITREPGKIIFDISGLPRQQQFGFAAWGEGNAAKITRVYLDITAQDTPDVPDTPDPPQSKYKYEGFSVQGTTLLDANGNPFVMRGVNHAHTWFRNQLNVALPAIAATGSNTVRIVLSNGERWQRDSAESVRRIIEMCKELEMIAVLEIHDATGRNNADDLMKAVDYWIQIKDELIGNEPYVIVNIANEWRGDWNGAAWRDGYTQAIPRLREAGIKNTLMVDAAGWGQHAASVRDFGRAVFESDVLGNTMFSIHMYEVAGRNAATVRSAIDGALAINVPLVIGEFGHKHGDANTVHDVAFMEILSYCEEKNVGYLGWSWKGNSAAVAYLDIAVEWDGSVLSADWGEILVNSVFGIRNTSKVCTIFIVSECGNCGECEDCKRCRYCGISPCKSSGAESIHLPGMVLGGHGWQVGSTASLTAYREPGNFNLANELCVTWSSSNPLIAYIEERGTDIVLVARRAGTTTVRATLNDGSGIFAERAYQVGGGSSSRGTGGGGTGTTTPPADTAAPPQNTVVPPTAANPNFQIRALVTGRQSVSLGVEAAGQHAILARTGANGEPDFVSAVIINAEGSAMINITATGEYIVIARKTGDITGTGEVGTADALELLRHIAGTGELNSVQLFAANGKSGDVSTTDALNILRYVAGVINKI
jgi:mannan endo-1,4-beta-mannosidase